MLVTSNGHSGTDREQLGSTSSNLKNSSLSLLGDAIGGMRDVRPGVEVLVGLVGGGVFLDGRLFLSWVKVTNSPRIFYFR